MSAFVRAVRSGIRGIAWRQWLTVLFGAAVIAAMVVVAESARRDAERHLHAQVLVERVRADGEAIAAVHWQGLANLRAGDEQLTRAQSALVHRGLADWASLSAALTQLHAIDPGAVPTRLEQAADTMYLTGTRAFLAFTAGDINRVMRVDDTFLRPQFLAFDGYAQQAAANQEAVASRASERAAVLDVGSLVVGLALLLLLGWRLHRQRRHASLSDARLALERRGEQRLRALVEHSSDVITVLDAELRVKWVSPSVAKLLGHEPDRALGRRLTAAAHPDDVADVEAVLERVKRRPGTVTLSARFRHAGGDWRDLEAIAENRLGDPSVQGIVLSMRDVTARRALENELRHQAFHDALTGLANRALFEDRLVQALARARRHHEPVAVLFLDLDDFKTINDSLGHEAGDELLRAVAIRIAAAVRAHDTAARLGGDEFAVVAETSADGHHAETVAARLLAAVTEPFTIAGRALRISASIGLAQSDGSIGVNELMRDADTAMYAAKDGGKNTVRTFEAGMHRRVVDRLELTGELQHAIEHGQFELDYQPIVKLQTGGIAGAEALVRWAHPERGRLSPAEFIGLAEETGLIVPLGAWILRSACEQAVRWARGRPEGASFKIGVNVSTRQLNDPAFPGVVRDILADTGMRPGSLVLEITESLLPEDGAAMIERLHQLKALGLFIAVDDFGTGYSALSRLHHFPIDIVKIDRSFITGIEHSGNKARLMQGIVSLAESLDLDVVAEGVELAEQADQLRGMRASHGQGYLFSRPVSPDAVGALLQDPDALALAA